MKLAAAGASDGEAAARAWYCGRAAVACSPPYWPLPYWPPLYWPSPYWPPLYWPPSLYWAPEYWPERDWSPPAAGACGPRLGLRVRPRRLPGRPGRPAAGAAPSAATFAYFSRKSMMFVASTQDA